MLAAGAMIDTYDGGADVTKSRPVQERFWDHVDKTDTCWIWKTGAPGSYPKIHLGEKEGSKRAFAHRLSYSWFVGPIPEGFHVHHECRETRCVNPQHLKAVSPSEHLHLGPTFQAANRKKTHCPQGHEFTASNIYPLRQYGIVGRGCRECRQIRNRQRSKIGRELLRL